MRNTSANFRPRNTIARMPNPGYEAAGCGHMDKSMLARILAAAHGGVHGDYRNRCFPCKDGRGLFALTLFTNKKSKTNPEAWPRCACSGDSGA